MKSSLYIKDNENMHKSSKSFFAPEQKTPYRVANILKELNKTYIYLQPQHLFPQISGPDSFS